MGAVCGKVWVHIAGWFQDPRALIYNTGMTRSGAVPVATGGVSGRPRFPPPLIRDFNDNFSRFQQQGTPMQVHPQAEDEEEPMPQPPVPLSLRNDSYNEDHLERHPYHFGFPTQREEVRGRPGPSAFSSTTSLYENNAGGRSTNWGEGQSLLQRGNSMGRMPPARPPQPNASMLSLSQQAARQLGSISQGQHRQPSQQNISRAERARQSQRVVDPTVREQLELRRKALREDE